MSVVNLSVSFCFSNGLPFKYLTILGSVGMCYLLWAMGQEVGRTRWKSWTQSSPRWVDSDTVMCAPLTVK